METLSEKLACRLYTQRTRTLDSRVHFLNGVQKVGDSLCFISRTPTQANGRVEVSGRVLKDIIRKVGIENGKSWIEILPCALRIRHDLINPEIDFSRYQLLFGRERPGIVLPWARKHV